MCAQLDVRFTFELVMVVAALILGGSLPPPQRYLALAHQITRAMEIYMHTGKYLEHPLWGLRWTCCFQGLEKGICHKQQGRHGANVIVRHCNLPHVPASTSTNPCRAVMRSTTAFAPGPCLMARSESPRSTAAPQQLVAFVLCFCAVMRCVTILLQYVSVHSACDSVP